MNLLRKIYLIPVFIYKKLISPVLPDTCRYEPSCSAYFVQAVEKHGIIKGTILGLSRIFRCNARFKSAYDPVPEEFSFSQIKQKNNELRFKTKTSQKK